ncbi:uncharacterized protein PV07_04540 [Cladophialophora immunda]|uniref:Uncharacterized protein n=1 Tax=Cladophialophora immunda TaxID=569365 RepID=A0A0D2CPC2_9EURO|nr:uncharacterized protein PV07_04540 [Cladophialophora immunda]KIW33038.1 hypothetical protein PV07_04540 [Cladophialophora immunda]
MPPPTSSDTTKSPRHHAWSTTSVKSGSTSGGHHHHRPQDQQYAQQHCARKDADAKTVQRWLDGRDHPAREDVLDRVARAFERGHGKDKREGAAKMKLFYEDDDTDDEEQDQ